MVKLEINLDEINKRDYFFGLMDLWMMDGLDRQALASKLWPFELWPLALITGCVGME